MGNIATANRRKDKGDEKFYKKLYNKLIKNKDLREEPESPPDREIEKIFINSDVIVSSKYFYMSFSITIIFLAIFTILLFDIAPIFSTLKEQYLEISSLFVAISSSITTGFVAVYFTNRESIKKIDKFQNLSNKNMLISTLTELSKYGKKYSENRVVELIFDSFITNSEQKKVAVNVTLNVRQRMHLDRHLRLGFRVIDKSVTKNIREGLKFEKRDLAAENALEDFISINIADLPENINIDLESMGVKEVIIESMIVKPSLEPNQNQTGLRIWTIDTSSYANSDPVQVSYTYKYIQEFPGFAFFETHLPTRGFRCILDATAVANDVEICSLETIEANLFSDPDQDDKARQTRATPKWVLPRRNVVWIWYEKQ